ncbi:MAG: V-type ATP synthase subunit I [Oscillospiraceae bacterium]|jgi:V/A-type H+-transporting ATPase subunit I|nr:V-type ATP synthase subunit I [Oscillospiraceae bacterium]
MAILAMKKVYIYALKKDRKNILELLQVLGVVEVEDLPLEDDIKKEDTSKATALFENSSNILEQAISILEKYIPKQGLSLKALAGKKRISLEHYNKSAKECDKVLGVAHKIINLKREITEKEAEIIKLSTQLEALSPWMSLDISMRFKGTKFTRAFIGTFPNQRTFADISEELVKNLPETTNFNLEIISSSREQTCIFLLCRDKNSEEIENLLMAMGFSYPNSPSKIPPKEKKVNYEEQINLIKNQVKAAENELKSYVSEHDSLQLMVDYYQSRAEKYNIIYKLAHTKHTFKLKGYIPERDYHILKKRLLDKFDVEIELKSPSEDENIPVILENNIFSSPLEAITESYSLPGKGEIDPTGVMSIFYYLLFGLMLSDAVYGLIMLLVCLFIVKKFKNLEIKTKKSMQMFAFCGISTLFWGIMFGSYFGDAVEVISNIFLSKPISIPSLWFVPVKEPMRMLTFSFAIGIIHIFTGLGIKLYQLIKAGEYLNAVYDVIFWYLLVGGGIVYLLSVKIFSNMLKISFILPTKVGYVASICAGIGALGIILTAGRDSKSPYKRLLKGLYGLYNITGYLSDILSYSRLLALGLTTGVIASVFNKMGSMGGTGPLGIILFTVVFIIGHSINIGINLLGAYVHTNRLQFVEFFGKFYEGGSRKFSPFCSKEKYYKIKESV